MRGEEAASHPSRFGSILRQAAARRPQEPAILAGDQRLSFAELDRRANQFAHFLLSVGVDPGDRIACLLFNRPEYPVVHFGSARAGSVLVHIPPLYAAAEIGDILRRAKPAVLVVDSGAAKRLPPEEPGGAETVIRVGSGGPGGAPGFEEALAGQPGHPPAVEVDARAPAAMTFTGGTTGSPKGTVVSQAARSISAAVTAREHGLTDRDIAAVVTPMCHAAGLMIWYQAAVLAGATTVFFRKWNPARFPAAVERHRISSAFMVPVQLRDLLRAPGFDARRLTSLRNIGVAGAVLPPGLIAECRTALPHCRLTNHYGQSETGPLTILGPSEIEAHPGTVGRRAAGVELEIADGRGGFQSPGVVGEVVARGPFLMEGYFADEAQTRRFFRGPSGWAGTGDLGFLDERGFLTLVGRTRERIASGGYNILPGEIETALASHPAVEECAVFGVPDERWGEAPIACVAAAAGRHVEADDLLRHCEGRLARYKHPRQVVFVDRIPRTAAGKVRKRLFREAYLAGRLTDDRQ